MARPRNRSPYWRYTRKDQGKTVGRHIGEEALAEVYRSQIEAFREYQALSAELVRISERLADEEAEKRGSGRRSKK